MTTSVSRRTFLGTAGAAAIGLPRLARAAMQKRAGRYKIGVQSFSLRAFDVDTAMKHAAAMGYQTIEYYKNHLSPQGTGEETDAIVAKTNKLGMQLIAHGVNGFTADHEANRVFFEFAKRAGLRCLSAHPDEDSFDSLEKLVAEYDIRIGIHNHGPTHHYNTIDDVLGPIKDRHPNLGACVDTGHFIRSGVDPVEAIEVLGDRVYGVHLKDFVGPGAKVEETMLGEGALDIDGVFTALRKVGFPADGYLSVEYEADKDNPIEGLTTCLKIARRAVRKSRG